jgi:ATP-binding cassette subfamily F protein uup
MEAAIEAAENAQAEHERLLGDPNVYAKEPQRVPLLQAGLEKAQGEVERLYARWQELQNLAAGGR